MVYGLWFSRPKASINLIDELILTVKNQRLAGDRQVRGGKDSAPNDKGARSEDRAPLRIVAHKIVA